MLTARSEREPIRVFLVDDHTMLREGLAALIDAEDDMVVVGQAAAAKPAVAGALELQPDVIVLDLLLPGGGLNALAEIRAARPEARPLALSVLDDLEHLRAAFAAGATGYLVKRAAAGALLSAIREAHRGEAYVGVDAETRRRLLAEPPPSTQRAVALKPRERDVLRLLASGHTHREVGARLGLSKKTVDVYRKGLTDKLGARGRADLVRYAIAAGLFGDPTDAYEG